MLKKLLLTVIGLMLLVLPLGCVLSEASIKDDVALGAEGVVTNDKETDNALAPVEEEDLAMPDDFLNGFYIIVSDPYGGGPFLDTKNNKVGNGSRKEYVSVDYYMPREKLQEIYDFITLYDIKSYSGQGLMTIAGYWFSPMVYCEIEFCLDGEVYSILFDSIVVAPFIDFPEQYRNLRAFADLMGRINSGIEEFKSLPPGPYLL